MHLLLQRFIFCRVLDIRVTQIMKADTGQSRPLEHRFHVAISRIRADGIFWLHRVGNIHWLMASVLRRRRMSTTLFGRMLVRMP